MSDRYNRDMFGTGLLEQGECYDDEAQLAISSYLDGEAEAAERRLAEYHLSSCRACQNMAHNWRQEARQVASTRFSDSAAYQVQAEVRAVLQPFLLKEASRPNRRPVSAFALTGGLVTVVAAGLCFLLLTRFTFNSPTMLDLASPVAMTINAGNTATAGANNTVMFSRMNTMLAATPTVAASLSIPASLSTILQTARAVRYYPAPNGRFAGMTAVLAWYGENDNRLWLVDARHSESEVLLSALAWQNEAVRFYFNDPQAVIWSERGAIVSYHLGNATVSEWGLVVPQAGQISAARLVQPPTAAALAQATISPLPRQ